MSDLTSTDLLGVQKALRDKHGVDGPSYVTLRRLASAGKLKIAERQTSAGSRRVLYSVDAVEMVVLTSTPLGKRLRERLVREQMEVHESSVKSPMNIETGERFSEIPEDIAQLNSRMEILLDSVAALMGMVEEQGKQIAALHTSVDRLEAVKRVLMSKYDNDLAQKGELISNLRGQLQQQKIDSELAGSLTKLVVGVGHLKESVNKLIAQT